MAKQRIVVLGGGFAGLWSAAGAARRLDELRIGTDDVSVTLVNRDAFHSIRVRNYESDLAPTRVPLSEVLEPIGVELAVGEVRSIDLQRQCVSVADGDDEASLPYDRLVMALGSELVRPALPGFAEYAFDVDTFGGAKRLRAHLGRLVAAATSPQQRDVWRRVLVVGAGLTGIELAAELAAEWEVTLADHSDHIGSNMGPDAQPVIAEALKALGVQTRVGVSVASFSAQGATLTTGETLAAATVVWCVGMRASPLTALFPVERDRWGRLPVDVFLRVKGIEHVFAAGDSAAATVDPKHASVMSCQHGRPMGRFAGHNVVGDLSGAPMLPLAIDWYVTVLDLGSWGAVYTAGWERRVVAVGAAAKATKRMINGERIYPPRGGDRRAIFDAAAPVVQRPPGYPA